VGCFKAVLVDWDGFRMRTGVGISDLGSETLEKSGEKSSDTLHRCMKVVMAADVSHTIAKWLWCNQVNHAACQVGQKRRHALTVCPRENFGQQLLSLFRCSREGIPDTISTHVGTPDRGCALN
jgi:hypothetical protein